LRRDLHAPELVVGATELRLNPVVVSSDVQGFEDALESGDLKRAAALYSGPFLDGFYLGEKGEFERWVEAVRSRLVQRMAAALELLARQAEGCGEHRAAADWWRRLAALDPLSSRAALGLMATLDKAGDPAEASREGRAHTEFVRQELGDEPAAEVAALIERFPRRTSPGRRALGEAGEVEITAAAAVPTAVRRVYRATAFGIAAVVGAMILVAGAGAYAVWSREGSGGGVAPLA